MSPLISATVSDLVIHKFPFKIFRKQITWIYVLTKRRCWSVTCVGNKLLEQVRIYYQRAIGLFLAELVDDQNIFVLVFEVAERR